MTEKSKIKSILKTMPNSPGVYQYFDKNGTIIYVGKAKNLRKRVLSYFNRPQESGKTKVLVKKIEDIKFIVVETEVDALLLENNLIKQYQPRYNILLKDDKTYPWICIKKEPFPRIISTRQKVKDGSQYFGPYASTFTMRTILDLVHEAFPLRTCNLKLSPTNIESGKFKVCLEYHIGNCLGPCEGYQTENEYKEYIDQIKNILKGNISTVIKYLKGEMKKASENLDFEKAQQFKLKLESLENYQSKSTVVSPVINNVDVVSLIQKDKWVAANYMTVVNGAIVQGRTVEIRKQLDENLSEILDRVIVQMREEFNSSSKEIIVQKEPNIHLPNTFYTVPLRGEKLKLLQLSERNVKYFIQEKVKQQINSNPNWKLDRVLEQMKKDLRLKELPKHIECFDNSNFQGTNPVAACVVFKNAKPSKKDYRHFNIKTVEGPDDFASMTEVVYRRYKRLLDERKDLPQLIVIDGGKGQLGAALKALEELNLRGKIAILGIAKKLEELFFPGDQFPLYLDKKSETLKIIQQLRNEAHRFGITHHRNRRSKNSIQSELLDIPGVGGKTLEKLLKHFKSVKRIKQANLSELETIISKSRAKFVFNHFHINHEEKN